MERGKDPGQEQLRAHALSLIILALVALLAYANAWPNALIWDDKVFLVGDRLSGVSLADIRGYFTDNTWAVVGADSGIYRPLLLLSVALDIMVFGDWLAGFHLVNIFLHMLVTVLVYGFVRYLLLVCGGEARLSGLAALLAALVFAVHPIHTEVVNSVFNRSEMLVSLGVTGGLWWFLPTVENQPLKAWSVLGFIYLLVMLCRESAIMLPAITVVVLWITTPGHWRLRLRKCMPVFWLLIPLAIYFGLRLQAMGSTLPLDAWTPDQQQAWEDDEFGFHFLGLFLAPGNLLPALAVWFDAIRIMLWPDPLLTFHEPSVSNEWIALALQIALLVFAFFRLVRNKPGLFLGLAFFYLSILPSSRIVGEYDVLPHLAERYLYMPSIGFTIVLAFGLGWLAQKFSFRTVAIPVMLSLMILTPLTWARNQQWTSNVRLANADYLKSRETTMLQQSYVKALFESGDLTRAANVCDKHTEDFPDHWYLAGNCAQVYASLERYDRAEQAFLVAMEDEEGRSPARFYLANMYLGLNRRDEAEKLFEQAILEETEDFLREYRTAEMLILLYPSDQEKLLKAKAHLEKALELEPQFYLVRRHLDKLNAFLDAGASPRD